MKLVVRGSSRTEPVGQTGHDHTGFALDGEGVGPVIVLFGYCNGVPSSVGSESAHDGLGAWVGQERRLSLWLECGALVRRDLSDPGDDSRWRIHLGVAGSWALGYAIDS